MIKKKQKCILLLKKYELIYNYISNPDSDIAIESAIILLEKYMIDIEKEAASIDIKELQRKINKNKNDISHFNNENKRLTKFLPMLFELEKEEIICVYHNYFEKIKDMNDSFFEQLIDAYRVFENMYLPNQIKQFYKNLK